MAGPRRTVAFGLATASAIVVLVAARVVLASKAELAAGDAARDAGDLDVARLHYRRAARWYAPASPYGADALDRLADLAIAAEAAGDPDAALASWRAMRAAIVSARSSYVPYAERLRRATDQIAALTSQTDVPPLDAGKSRAELRAEHRRLLEPLPRPKPGWALSALLGFVVWVGAAFLFASRGIDADDRVQRPEAIRWGVLGVLGLLLFFAGLSGA